MDRLTNGTGEVSSIAAAAFSNLYLKDRYGAFTGAHPLTFTQFLDYVKGKLTNNYTRGFAVVVDCKPAKDKVTFTEWTALMEGWNQMVSYTSNMTNSDALNFRDAFIWKIKARKLPPADGSNPLAASKAMEGLPFFWDANNRVRGQNLIAIYYSTDEDMKKPPYQTPSMDNCSPSHIWRNGSMRRVIRETRLSNTLIIMRTFPAAMEKARTWIFCRKALLPKPVAAASI